MAGKAGAMIYLSGYAVMIAAFGFWFARQAYRSWLNSDSGEAYSERRWMIGSGLGALICLAGFIGLVGDMVSLPM